MACAGFILAGAEFDSAPGAKPTRGGAEIKKMILYSKTSFKHSFKDFWYLKINPTQTWYDKFNLLKNK